MKGITKNYFFIIYCSILCTFLNNLVAIDNATDAQESSIFSELIKTNFERIKNLNYFTSKNLAISLPNDQEIYIDWGFAGSGDILSPYPKITTVFRAKENKDLAVDSATKKEQSEGASFSSLLKIFLKSKLRVILKEKLEGYSSGLAFFDWISKIDQSPFAPFALKLLLLSQHDFEGQGARRNIEIVRLVVRLAQSGLFVVSDYQKSLFSYLPDVVQGFLKQNLSEDQTRFVDEIWTSLGKGVKDYEFDSKGAYLSTKVGIYVAGYVFDDTAVAAKSFERIVGVQNVKKNVFSYSCFEEEMDKIVPVGYEVLDFKDFAKYKGLKNYKFVGYKSFGRINKEIESEVEVDKYLPEKIKNEVLSALGLPKLLKIEISDKETWILYISDKLTTFDTLKMSFIGLLKGYEEFKQIRSKDLACVNSQDEKKTKLSDQEVAELKKMYSDKAQMKKAIDDFERKRKNAELNLQKQKISAGKDAFSQDSLATEQKEYDLLVGKGKALTDELLKTEKRIRELEIKAADTLIEIPNDVAASGKNAFNLLLRVFVSSPELNEMFAAFRGSDPKYKVIRENLIRRLTYIFRNAENFNDNLETYQFLIAVMFPEFKQEFDRLIASPEFNKTNNSSFFDGVLKSLGL